MGLIAGIRRWHYVWSWRARYWWHDTEQGEMAHWAVCALGAIVCVIQLIRMFVAAALPPPPGEPAKAVYWWVVQLIIAIVSAAISYAMRPKPDPPKPQEIEITTTEDGLAAKHYFGTCWVEDKFRLAWKVVKRTPIKTKGGKK